MISRSLLALGALAILVGTPIETDARPLRRLAIEERGTEHAWVSWGSEPVFAYGLSPQNLLTCLPPEGAPDPDLDVLDFAEWAEARGITIVRSYPPSSIQSPRGLDAFERAASDSTRFDLTRFDPRYFERLRDACITLQTHDVIVHLQLWQAVV